MSSMESSTKHSDTVPANADWVREIFHGGFIDISHLDAINSCCVHGTEFKIHKMKNKEHKKYQTCVRHSYGHESCSATSALSHGVLSRSTFVFQSDSYSKIHVN